MPEIFQQVFLEKSQSLRRGDVPVEKDPAVGRVIETPVIFPQLPVGQLRDIPRKVDLARLYLSEHLPKVSCAAAFVQRADDVPLAAKESVLSPTF